MWERLVHISWIIKARHPVLELSQVIAVFDKMVFSAGRSQLWEIMAWTVLLGGWSKTACQIWMENIWDAKRIDNAALGRGNYQGSRERLDQKCPILKGEVGQLLGFLQSSSCWTGLAVNNNNLVSSSSLCCTWIFLVVIIGIFSFIAYWIYPLQVLI